jgi:hypothetical protein
MSSSSGYSTRSRGNRDIQQRSTNRTDDVSIDESQNHNNIGVEELQGNDSEVQNQSNDGSDREYGNEERRETSIRG